MRRATCHVGFCLVVLAGFALSAASARAEDGALAGAPLPFWEIGLSAFDADSPQAVAVPLPSGTRSYHWSWTFTFRAEPNLDRVRRIYNEILPTLDEKRQELLRNDIEALEATLAEPLRVPVSVRLVTDKGTVVADTSNTAIRNLVEKKRGKRYETIREIAARTLEPGEGVRGVATFPDVPAGANLLEIQVTGLGRRVSPSYRPGALRTGADRADPTVQRVLRFRYRRIGQHVQPRLTPVEPVSRSAGWAWIWTAQIYPGAPRRVEIAREVDGETTLRRTYYYAPYRIWNNTYDPQPIAVETAGLRVPVRWRGETIPVRMLDEGVDNYWKTLVRREARSRIETGREAEFVRQYELPRTDTPDAVPEATVERRILDLPARDGRHVETTIAPGQIANGLLIVRSGPTALAETVTALVADLRMAAVAGTAREEPSGLMRAYADLRPDVPEETPGWKRPPEPSVETVTERLLVLAEEDLAARRLTVTAEDARRWGTLAPLGVLLRSLAEEELHARLEQGVVDMTFTVRRDDITETSAFPAHIRRELPEPWVPARPRESEYAEAGARK